MPPTSSAPKPPSTPSSKKVARDLKDPRTVRFVLRFRPSERDHLEALAQEHGQTLTELCRHRLLEWDLPRPKRTLVEAEFYALFSQISVSLRNTSNNLNQLAKAAHLGFPVGADEVAQSVKKLQREMDELRRSMALVQGD